MKSLLKWAGAKGWLLDRYAHLLPDPSTIMRYREPFLGSGAVAKHYIKRCPCALSDKNERLMAMYRGVRDYPETVIYALKQYAYDAGTYAIVRAAFNMRRGAGDAQTAAWFLYLNRTCFNGLYRENCKGEFNVPFGRYTNPTICDEETILEWSKALKCSSLWAMGWREALSHARDGEFVFLDPPYVPASNTANFTAYQAGGFSAEDQEDLGAYLTVLDDRGVHWMLTNIAEAKPMYGAWNVMEVDVPRAINSVAGKRGPVKEIIVSNRAFSMQEAA